MSNGSKKRMMLISNSFVYGKGYLEHCASAIQDFLGPIHHLVFIPYALKGWDAYTDTARTGFAKFGISITSIHEVKGVSYLSVLESASAIFVGGGNTYRLLEALYHYRLMDPIKEAVTKGRFPYLGASAGANVSCPTIRTTNDWRIVDPPSMYGLDIFPWQINPHFIDSDPTSKHMGETREKRIAEFQEENETAVVGLREGSWIVVENGVATLQGNTGARLFTVYNEPKEWQVGHSLIM